jgi:hypothetical protein
VCSDPIRIGTEPVLQCPSISFEPHLSSPAMPPKTTATQASVIQLFYWCGEEATCTFNPIVGTVSTGAPLASTLNRVVFPLPYTHTLNQLRTSAPACSRCGRRRPRRRQRPVLEAHEHHLELLRVKGVQHALKHRSHDSSHLPSHCCCRARNSSDESSVMMMHLSTLGCVHTPLIFGVFVQTFPAARVPCVRESV